MQKQRSIFISSVAVAFFGIAASSANALDINWANAPLACLPDRAVPWMEESEKEPCHCPPQSYCPEPLELDLGDVSFLVTTGLDFYGNPVKGETTTNVIHGNEIPELVSGQVTIEEIFAYESNYSGIKNEQEKKQAKQNDENNLLRNLIEPAFKDKFGAYLFAPTNQHGRTQLAEVKISIDAKNTSVKTWLDNAKMPLPLVAQCCESPCPDGLNPELVMESVQTPKNERYYRILSNAGMRFSKNSRDYNDAAKTFLEANAPDLLIYESLEAARSKVTDQLGQGFYDPFLVDTIYFALREYINMIDFAPVLMSSLISSQAATLQYVYEFQELVEADYNLRHDNPEHTSVSTLQCAIEKSFLREGCLKEGTLVKMYDGSDKPIEELKLGDYVLGNHGPAKILAKSRFAQEEDHMYSINGGEAFFTIEHPILTVNGWKSINPAITSTQNSDTKIIGILSIGDEIIKSDRSIVKVTSITKEVMKNGANAYNLSVEGDGSFFANGFVMKGFKQMQMHY
ncbi:MAG: Hint domain-containing protein [Pseudomonadota bacterium]